MTKYVFLLILVWGFSLEALPLNEKCNANLKAIKVQKQIFINFSTPQGEMRYRIDRSPTDISPIEQFLMPYFRSFEEKNRVVLSVMVNGKDVGYNFLSGFKLIKNQLNIVFKDNSQKTYLVNAEDIDEIELGYDDTQKIITFLKDIGALNFSQGNLSRKPEPDHQFKP